MVDLLEIIKEREKEYEKVRNCVNYKDNPNSCLCEYEIICKQARASEGINNIEYNSLF